MSLTRKIAHNTIIQLIGKALGIGLSLFSIGLLTRYLGQTGFGYYTTIIAFLQVFGILVDFGLQMTTIQMIADPSRDEAKTLGNILGLRLVSSIIFLGLAPLIVLLFPYPPAIKLGIFILSVSFLFNSLFSILTGVFQKYLAMHKVAIADLINRIIQFAFIFAIAVYISDPNTGLMAILVASIVANGANYFILFAYSKKYIPFRFRFEINEWLQILGKTWPIALTIALNLIYFKADTIILSLFRSQAEVGIYGAPYKILEVLINLAYLFLGLLLPLMANYYAAKNIDEFKKILQKGFDAMTAVAIPLVCGTYFLGVPIMVTVAGEQFAVSGEILKILMLATAAIFIAALFGYGVVAIDKQKQMIKFYLINAIISLGLYLVLIPIYSYWAAAWLTVFTEIFILATACWIIYRHLAFIPDFRIFYKSVLSSLIMCVPLYLLPSLNIFILIALACVVYFVAMFLVKGFSKELVFEILKLKK